ncbi:hypothetical protein H6F51_22800 [Cyanobacteria bacterium FACHB-DQ100]|uniref:hypothetical protein n=1 Tax=unclassified Leptolyngbya TaxID=2650499 RepID=UPI001680871B|nr:hypothetical protein [Leptolyngbya sp. FACHB-17]MBD1825303.1 hypothetical protein [Cyanobacteria bacterium FACHB-DQ100]MBD2081812.1 hypothetical protein [Leptolyngbya sp. FACHB-17]
MNQNGRLTGAVLIGLALLLIARAAATFSSGNQSNNQLNPNSNNQLNQNQAQDQAFAQTPPDRLPINDFNASRVGVAELNPSTGTGDLNTPGSGSDNVADNSGNGTGSGLPAGASTRPVPPVVQGAW